MTRYFPCNTDETHPGAKYWLQKDGISVAHSVLPGALSAIDKTMEETFMTITQEGKKETSHMTPFFHLFFS